MAGFPYDESIGYLKYKERGSTRLEILEGSLPLATIDPDGYAELVGLAGAVGEVPWANVTGTPTTLGGYGIEDAYTKAQSDARYPSLSAFNAHVADPLHPYLDHVQTWTGENRFTDLTSVCCIQFDLLENPTLSEGQIAWQPDEGTAGLGMPGGNVTLQIGSELLMPRAKAGEDTLNGQMSYISGGAGANPVFSLGDASGLPEAAVVGMATEDVANSHFGYWTNTGLVRDLNTAAYPAGTTLWLDTVAGGWTDTRPVQPNFGVVVGQVIRQHATEGIIFTQVDIIPRFVSLSDVLVDSLTDYQISQWDDTGGVWRNQYMEDAGARTMKGWTYPYDATLTYNKLTRVVSVVPTVDTATYWTKGGFKREIGTYNFSAHAAATDIYFFYFDDTDTPQISTTPWDFDDDVMTAFVYYSATMGEGVAYWELHHANKAPGWHRAKHFSVGTTYDPRGFAVTGYSVAPSSPANADNTWAMATGTIYDEEIPFDIAAQVDGADYTVWYRTGATGEWVWQTGLSLPFTVSGTYRDYNEWTGATWQLTEGATQSYQVSWSVLAPALEDDHQRFIMLGQETFSTLEEAEAYDFSSLDLGDFPIQEFVVLDKHIWKLSAGYGGATGRCRIESFTRLGKSREASLIAPGGVAGMGTTGYFTGWTTPTTLGNTSFIDGVTDGFTATFARTAGTDNRSYTLPDRDMVVQHRESRARKMMLC